MSRFCDSIKGQGCNFLLKNARKLDKKGLDMQIQISGYKIIEFHIEIPYFLLRQDLYNVILDFWAENRNSF